MKEVFRVLLFGFMTFICLMLYMTAMISQNILCLTASILWLGMFLFLFPVFRKPEEINE